MKRRELIKAGPAAWLAGPSIARAQSEPLRIGLILPMTGAFASTGRQVDAAVRLYMQDKGGKLGGRPVEIVLKDDAGVADNTRRIAQELITAQKVALLTGFGLTPGLLAVGPMLAQAKVPALVMAAASAAVIGASPYVVRTSYHVPQAAAAMAEWAARNGLKRVTTLVTDFAPGIEAERAFSDQFRLGGGEPLAQVRMPITTQDFSPYLQRVRDTRPDAVYVWVPSGPGAVLMKQYRERGLADAGIRIIGDGGVTDDDSLNAMGDVALGVVTAFHYSAAHPSAANKRFVEAFTKAHGGMRPNFMAVGGYDGMEVLSRALAATRGQARGDALLEAMKGQAFESPRGPVLLNAQTRDMVQNMYIRRVERQNGELFNIEIDVFKDIKVPTSNRS